MRASFVAVSALAALLCNAGSASAQGQRLDAIWARSTAGQHITLDGVLDEPAWQNAESVLIRYGVDAGIPGSGWKEEGGKLAKDSTYVLLKFLVDGNQLYMGATALDASVGGSVDFNREDGFLMSIKDHSLGTLPAPPTEFFYSWWYPVDSTIATNPGLSPCFRSGNTVGRFAQDTCSKPRTAAMIAAWNCSTYVHGLSNSDAANDTGYTVEMRWDLSTLGYDVTGSNGDIVEFNLSVYDTDWLWPINLNKFSANRTWIQSPWGNTAWYDELHIYSKPSVTINSGAAPLIPPEMRIAHANGSPPPTIDGHLNETIWSIAPSFDIRYNDASLPPTYPGIGRWRAGQYQPTVNGSSNDDVVDPGDATVKMFYNADTLYLGFDVRDQLVQYYSLFDRWDGFIITLTDRVKRWQDHNLWTWRASFQVSPSGTLLAQDQLPYLVDTLGAIRCALALKPGTTVDTVGQQADAGYQAEFAIDLTKLGYPANLGDRWLWLGLNLLDGDSLTPYTDSYADRTWWFRDYENDCCPINAYLDPNQPVTAVDPGGTPDRLALLGNAPNPFRSTTLIRCSLPTAGEVMLEVFDLQGRVVSSRSLGVRPPGTTSATFTAQGVRPGLYLYRLRVIDPATRKETASLPGKMLLVR
jgi:hypothetical protein